VNRQRRATVLAAGAFACLILGGGLVLLASDVLRWRGHLEGADVLFAQSPGDLEAWEPPSQMTGRAARSLLGVDDDIEFRQALQRFRLARSGQAARNQFDVTRRAQADLALAGVVADDPSPGRRSRAATLRGVLAFAEARQSTGRVASLLQRTLEQFREAIRLDPASEEPKYDLELVLSLIRRSDEEAEGQGEGRSPRRGSGQGSGAGSSQPSSGF
jgi:hypothetical protein